MEGERKKYDGNVTLTDGIETAEFRAMHGTAKSHAADAWCIAGAALMGQSIFTAPEEPYQIKQYRRHDRALIKAQTQRTYSLDDEVVAKNRRKATAQAEDSLEEWHRKICTEHGRKKAAAMRSRLTVTKSSRRCNNPKRIMSGTVFTYKGERHVLKGQRTNGQYWIPEDDPKRNIPASQCRIVKPNTGLVFL